MNRQKSIKIRSAGLNEEEITASREQNGRNILTKGKTKSFIAHFFSNLGDPVIKILLFALGVNLIFVFRGGDWIETLGIGISVFLATFISTLSERGSEAAFRLLSEECENVSCKVRRAGKVREVPISDIVVGDIVLIGAGEHIPADGYVIDGRIRVDQSSLTGESREIEKTRCADRTRTPASRSAVFRGCPVLSGDAEMEVFAVGDKTFLGEISHEVQLDTRESPLKIRLEKLARQISRLGYLAAFLVAAAYLFNTFVIDSAFNMQLAAMKLGDIPFLLEHLLHAFMFGLTVIVVAVPEGLPMMIAVVLSSNIKKMIRSGVLVRKPVGIEAAGSMNILFTDKTGTLTEGKMSVGKIFTADLHEYSGFSEMSSKASPAASLFALSAKLNTSSILSDGKALGGNATDRALLDAVSASKSDGAYTLTYKLPFDSARKYSLACVSGRERLTLIKGAPEKILPYVQYCYDDALRVAAFSEFEYSFRQKIGELTANGGRVIIIAVADGTYATGEIPRALTLLCGVLLEDRIRPEARRSVYELRDAGVHVVMITGDNKSTAKSIAKKCGIVGGGVDIVLESEELAAISDEKLKKLLPSLAVVARALPSDKSRLVRVAQECELVVGMTGDGINDAPALKRADIGFSMGSGTQVARDAGDIIILDNNLASISRAVLYGRTIFKSIRKFIVLQLTMNFCAVGISMICPFIGFDSPVTVVQMLWINIIMDTLGGLAFAGEAPLESCMKEKPKRRDEPILNRYMVNQIIFLGSFTIGLCLTFLKSSHITSNFRAAPDNIYLLTAFFALFIFASVFNCFNSRTDRLNILAGISKNKAFISIMSAVCVIQLLFVYLGGSVLRTAPLMPRELFTTMSLALLVFPADFIRKLIWRMRGRKNGF